MKLSFVMQNLIYRKYIYDTRNIYSLQIKCEPNAVFV